MPHIFQNPEILLHVGARLARDLVPIAHKMRSYTKRLNPARNPANFSRSISLRVHSYYSQR